MIDTIISIAPTLTVIAVLCGFVASDDTLPSRFVVCSFAALFAFAAGFLIGVS